MANVRLVSWNVKTRNMPKVLSCWLSCFLQHRPPRPPIHTWFWSMSCEMLLHQNFLSSLAVLCPTRRLPKSTCDDVGVPFFKGPTKWVGVLSVSLQTYKKRAPAKKARPCLRGSQKVNPFVAEQRPNVEVLQHVDDQLRKPSK